MASTIDLKKIESYKNMFLQVFQRMNMPNAYLAIGTCVDDYYPAHIHNENLEHIAGEPTDLLELEAKIAKADVHYEHHFQVGGNGFQRFNLNLAAIQNGDLEHALYQEGEVNHDNIVQRLNKGLIQIAVNPGEGILVYGVPGDAYACNTDKTHGTGPGFATPFAIAPELILGFELAMKEYNPGIAFVKGKHPDCGLMANNLQHPDYSDHKKVREHASKLLENGEGFTNSGYYHNLEVPLKDAGLEATLDVLGRDTTIYASNLMHRTRTPGAVKVLKQYI